tara:strand:+ start:222 stop:434 length:213 start_codon:yes stop_codon:yes gene_type:complete
MPKLQEMLDSFLEAYQDAPLYGSYSRTMKRKIPAKSQVRSEFIENIQMLSILTNDPAVKERITSILKSFE